MTAKIQVKQSDVPAHGLRDSLRVAEALRDEYAKQPAKPIDVARVLQLGPQGSQFKTITGASIAWGLTEGGAHAEAIGLTELGRRIIAPTKEGDDVTARRQALLTPRVVGDFLKKYNDSPLPSPDIARNVLEEMGVPSRATQRAHELIVTEADALGLLVDIKDRKYVNLDSAPATIANGNGHAGNGHASETVAQPVSPMEEDTYEEDDAEPVPPVAKAPTDTDRVFVTHGSNKAIVEQIQDILTFGKFVPVVSVQKEATAKPVPDKVLDDMRGCYAAIVHVGTEKLLTDAEGNEERMLNPNVLIEIGAAMALYGRRFVLLVEKGITLPSNLQGLYEVRYEGAKLDYEATMKLLKAFNEFRNV
jgi:predicted nucleotide-binding protein